VNPLDTLGLRYSDSSHGIVVKTLQGPLDIKLFNMLWFDEKMPTEYPVFVTLYMSLPCENDQPQWQQAARNGNEAIMEVDGNEPLHLIYTFEDLYAAVR
jgi:hypothetical protein